MPNLAMRQPGTQFSADGLDLSWPIGGEREVVAVPEEAMTHRIRMRIANGSIAITDEKPNKEAGAGSREYRLMTGEEARKHMAEPAGPVTRIVYHPAVPEDERQQLEVQDVSPISDRALAAAEARAAAAEERHAAITQAQIEAEKAAAEADDEDEDEEPDPIAGRFAQQAERQQQVDAARAAAADEAFMKREKERQKEEADLIKHQPAPAAEVNVGVAKVQIEEPDTSEHDKTVMAAEKSRQKVEAKVEKERSEAAKAAIEEGEKTPSEGYAGKTDPFVGPSGVGARPGTGVTAQDRLNAPKPEKKATKKGE